MILSSQAIRRVPTADPEYAPRVRIRSRGIELERCADAITGFASIAKSRHDGRSGLGRTLREFAAYRRLDLRLLVLDDPYDGFLGRFLDCVCCDDFHEVVLVVAAVLTHLPVGTDLAFEREPDHCLNVQHGTSLKDLI